MLHVIYAAWKKAHPADGLRLRAVYIRSQDPFPEMERFVEETQKRQSIFLHYRTIARSGFFMAKLAMNILATCLNCLNDLIQNDVIHRKMI